MMCLMCGVRSGTLYHKYIMCAVLLLTLPFLLYGAVVLRVVLPVPAGVPDVQAALPRGTPQPRWLV